MDVPALSRSNDIVELLRERAALHPERVALRFLGDGDNVTEKYDYAEIDARARAIAAELREAGPAGERALLLFPSGAPYVTALLGCFYAGWIAVPAYPPDPSHREQVGRILSIARSAQPRLILTQNSLLEPLRVAARALPEFGQVRLLAVDAVESERGTGFLPAKLGPESVAILQYTSGSTAQPKGVMVTHRSLMANERVIRGAFAMQDRDVVVSWLPLFHDMGLIGSLLQSLFSGLSLVLLAPQHFIERPVRWLWAIARHRGTVSGGPDFAYRLCAERISAAAFEGLDLSSWRLAFCGAEPIRPKTLHAFADRLAPSGFSGRALYPCYGLAESSLLVSGGRSGAGAKSVEFDEPALALGRVVPRSGGRALVACGTQQPEHEVSICDLESGAVLPPNQVGEVVVSGPSLALGYWQNEEATRQTFVRRGERVALRTGDLGFVHEGQLFITGRHKDVIIVRGHNLYPQDIERSVEDEVEVVRKGRVVAFSAELGGEERICVAAEVSPRLQKLIDPAALGLAIAEAVARGHGEAVGLVLLLNAGALPITTSGKLQRALARKRWQAGTLDTFASFAPPVTPAALSPQRP